MRLDFELHAGCPAGSGAGGAVGLLQEQGEPGEPAATARPWRWEWGRGRPERHAGTRGASSGPRHPVWPGPSVCVPGGSVTRLSALPLPALQQLQSPPCRCPFADQGWDLEHRHWGAQSQAPGGSRGRAAVGCSLQS